MDHDEAKLVRGIRRRPRQHHWEAPVTDRLHVLHVCQPTSTGAAVVALTYIREQLGRGWNVTVACPSDGWLGYAARDLGARVRWWPARRSALGGVVSEATLLSSILKEVDPDIVHLHSEKAGLVGRLVLRGSRVTLYQPHGWSFLALSGRARSMAVAWERRATRWTDEVVCVSLSEKRLAREAGIEAAFGVFPNGVDLDAWPCRRESDREQARRELDLGAEPIALCVGRLTEQKGQHDLLDIWPAVREQLPEARLVLIGDGPERAELTSRAAEAGGVVLLGSRADVATWISASNVVVAPSRWEGMALVPLEAMASGRSVVASRAAGTGESVPEGAGVVIPIGPSKFLTEALVHRLRYRGEADDEGLVGRAHVEANHSAASSAAAVSADYLRLLLARRAAGSSPAAYRFGPEHADAF